MGTACNHHKPNLLIQSKAGNNYFVSGNIPQVLLVHPILKYLIQLQEKGVNIPQWIENQKTSVTIDHNINASPKDLRYYYHYLQLLKQNGYTGEAEISPMTGNRYTARMIEDFIINTGHITFEVTDACMLSCKYCGYGSLYTGFDKREEKSMSVKTAKGFIDYIYRLKETNANRRVFKKLVFGLYGGEPLMNFSFIRKIVAYTRSKKWTDSGVVFRMTTNGVLLDRYMDYLVENKFILAVSLDGNEENNGYRVFKNGRPSFDTVFRNVLKLKEKHPAYFDEYVSFYAVIHKKNSLKQAAAFFRDTLNKTPLAAELSMVGVNTEKLDEFYKIYQKAYDELKPREAGAFSKRRRDIDKHPARFDLTVFLTAHTNYKIKKYSQLLEDYRYKAAVRTGTCDPFKMKIFITVHGKILPCEKIPQTYYLGEVDDRGVRLDYEKAADRYNKWYEKLSTLCNSCHINHNCKNCIFNINLEDDPCSCTRFKGLDAYKNDLKKNLSVLEETPLLYASILKKRG